MAGSVNKAIVLGYLGDKPKISGTSNGKRVAQLSVATNESWRDKTTGERREATDWHRVVIFDEKLIEVADKYLKKGSHVYIEGAMKTRKWHDATNGVDRWTTEVVLSGFHSQLQLLDRAPGERTPTPDPDSYGSQRTTPPDPGASDRGAMDDEIPF